MPSNSCSVISPINNTSPERVKNDLKIITKVLNFESLPAEKKINVDLNKHVETKINEKLNLNLNQSKTTSNLYNHITNKNLKDKLNTSIENDHLDLTDAYKSKVTNKLQTNLQTQLMSRPHTRMTHPRKIETKPTEELDQSGFEVNENRSCVTSL